MPDDVPTLFSIALSQARIESKFDTMFAAGQDHEVRIRTIESERDNVAHADTVESLDLRIRSLEADRDEHSFIRNHIPTFATIAAVISAACAIGVLIHSLLGK